MKRAEQLGVAILLVGALRLGYAAVHSQPEPRIDARYAGLNQLLPASPEELQRPIGYLSESGLATLEGQRQFGAASYALSPHILLPDDGGPVWVVVDLEDPARLGEIAQREHLHFVGGAPSGAALFSRSPH